MCDLFKIFSSIGNYGQELQQFRKIAIRPTDLTPNVVATTNVPEIIILDEVTVNAPKANQTSTDPIALPERSPVAPKKTYSNRKKSLVSSASAILHLENTVSPTIEEPDNFT